jgi:hypothetical protein
MSLHHESERLALQLVEPLRSGVLCALSMIPPHRAPRVGIDSQSPWVIVDAVPEPTLAVWRETGAVYKVGPDGAVEDDPVGP